MLKNGEPQMREFQSPNFPLSARVFYADGWPYVAVQHPDANEGVTMSLDQLNWLHYWVTSNEAEPAQAQVEEYVKSPDFYEQVAGHTLTMLVTMYGAEGLSMIDVNRVIDSLKSASNFLHASTKQTPA